LSDGTRLYWISGTQFQVRGCIAKACAQSLVSYGASGSYVGSSRQRLRNLDVTGERVVWKSPAGITSCPKSGCNDQSILLASDSVQWRGLSASGSDVYWSSDLDIYRCADTGCSSIPNALASGEITESKLVFWGSNAYWISLEGIRRAARDGSMLPTTLVATGLASANRSEIAIIDELGIDAEHLYWLGNSGQIFGCPIEGCAPEAATVLVPTETEKYAFQVDASGMYWIDKSADGAVVHCPLTGCTEPNPVTPAGVRDFALDEASLYWTDNFPEANVQNANGGINIRRIAKPTTTP